MERIHRGRREKLWLLGVGRACGGGGRPEVGSVAAVIGLMPEQRETGFFSGIPRKATSAAQQIDFRFNSQTNKVCHLAHYIGVSARCFPVISDQTYTFLAQHGRLILAHGSEKHFP